MPEPAVLRTARLELRRLTRADAGLIHELFNDPAFLRFVGDRGIRTVEDAERFLVSGPIASYEKHGFGLWRVDLAAAAEPVGICGLLRRDQLPAPDIGFAVLERYRSRGYATEAALAVLDYARRALGLERVLAIAAPDNEISHRILTGLGLRREGTVRWSESASEICLFATPDARAPAGSEAPERAGSR